MNFKFYKCADYHFPNVLFTVFWLTFVKTTIPVKSAITLFINLCSLVNYFHNVCTYTYVHRFTCMFAAQSLLLNQAWQCRSETQHLVFVDLNINSFSCIILCSSKKPININFVNIIFYQTAQHMLTASASSHQSCSWFEVIL